MSQLTFKDAKYYRDVTDSVGMFSQTNPDVKIMVPYVNAVERIDDELSKSVPVWMEVARDMEDVVFRMRTSHDPQHPSQTVENYTMLPNSFFYHNGSKVIYYLAMHQVPIDPFELWFARFRFATFFGVRNLKP